jgi:hypothetical protein
MMRFSATLIRSLQTLTRPGFQGVYPHDPGREIVSHEITVHCTTKKLAESSAKELIAASACRKIVEGKLRKRAISLNDYTLAYVEIGHYRRGRNSLQDIMAPYYAYFYMPKAENQYARKLLEQVANVSNTRIPAMINRDEQRDWIGRKCSWEVLSKTTHDQ